MQIGEVAEQVGLSLRTVRYYEEIGLVIPSGRSPGGFRQYDESDVRRLMIARDLKPLGFSLDEIREIVSVVMDHGTDGIDRGTLHEYVERARAEHVRAQRSLQAAERIIQTLESLDESS